MLFEAIFEHPDSTVWNIFTRIAVTPEFETLRDDILFFVEQYVVNTSKAAMAEKFKIAKKALNNAAGVLILQKYICDIMCGPTLKKGRAGAAPGAAPRKAGGGPT
ncbi:hypothetical protein Syun_002321 [Stephania yunnanensis]|uniref:Uncharacterized protein n=1 Tax=Stephania yunnanensis TaxID=152371 RepID=A0AAP0LFK0_9MAGN